MRPDSAPEGATEVASSAATRNNCRVESRRHRQCVLAFTLPLLEITTRVTNEQTNKRTRVIIVSPGGGNDKTLRKGHYVMKYDKPERMFTYRLLQI